MAGGIRGAEQAQHLQHAMLGINTDSEEAGTGTSVDVPSHTS